MDVFTVCFFGHRAIEDAVATDRRLDRLLRKLLLEKAFVEFLVGRDGDFDLLAASAVIRAKKAVRDDNSALVWVLPYATADLKRNYQSYSAYEGEHMSKSALAPLFTPVFHSLQTRRWFSPVSRPGKILKKLLKSAPDFAINLFAFLCSCTGVKNPRRQADI